MILFYVPIKNNEPRCNVPKIMLANIPLGTLYCLSRTATHTWSAFLCFVKHNYILAQITILNHDMQAIMPQTMNHLIHER